MKNEKGVTLIELLAALAIGVFLIGTMSSLFSSISLTWNSAKQKYNDDAHMRLTLEAYTKKLASAVRVFPVSDSSHSELRFEMGSNTHKYKAFFYDNDTSQLILYDYEGDFMKTSYDSASYSNAMILLDKNDQNDPYLSSAPIYLDGNSRLLSKESPSVGLIKISLSLNQSTKVKTYPNDTQPLSIKLLKDK